jgi:hypothetical protein
MTRHPRIELTDELIERMLATRAGSRAPEDIVEAIVSAAATTPQRRRHLVPALHGIARPRTAWLMIGAVLALLGIIIAATAVGSYLLRPRTTLIPVVLQADWRSVGTRVVPGPGPGGINTYSLGILIDPTSIDIQNFHTDVVNSARLVAPDRFEIRAITMGDFWHCAVGDVGLYTFSLTAGDRQLTLTPVSDACVERAIVLAGDWSRTDFGDLQPGRHDADLFRPFGGTGHLAYAVPVGWAGLDANDSLYALGRPDVSGQAEMRLLSNVSASAASCNENRSADGVGRTPAAMAAWLKAVPGLIVSPPTAVTIGGLSGVAVDLSVVPGWTPTCGAPGIYTFSFWGSDNGGWSNRLALNGSARARYVLLDRGDGSTLVIAIEAPDLATWHAFIAEAMPVIQSFEFTR